MSKYCHKCGQELKEDERYCIKCGAQINQDSNAPEEKLLYILPKTQVRPGFSDFDLYITDKRIVAAKVGTILKSVILDDLKTAADRKKLESLNLDEILNARDKNFEWNISNDIESIKIKKHMGITRLTLILNRTSGLKKKYLVFDNSHYEIVRMLLWEIAPNKITGDIGTQPIQPTVDTPTHNQIQPGPQAAQPLPPYCPNCGVRTIPNTIFCSKCGLRFNENK